MYFLYRLKHMLSNNQTYLINYILQSSNIILRKQQLRPTAVNLQSLIFDVTDSLLNCRLYISTASTDSIESVPSYLDNLSLPTS